MTSKECHQTSWVVKPQVTFSRYVHIYCLAAYENLSLTFQLFISLVKGIEFFAGKDVLVSIQRSRFGLLALSNANNPNREPLAADNAASCVRIIILFKLRVIAAGNKNNKYCERCDAKKRGLQLNPQLYYLISRSTNDIPRICRLHNSSVNYWRE